MLNVAGVMIAISGRALSNISSEHHLLEKSYQATIATTASPGAAVHNSEFVKFQAV